MLAFLSDDFGRKSRIIKFPVNFSVSREFCILVQATLAAISGLEKDGGLKLGDDVSAFRLAASILNAARIAGYRVRFLQ